MKCHNMIYGTRRECLNGNVLQTSICVCYDDKFVKVWDETFINCIYLFKKKEVTKEKTITLFT